MKPAGRVLVSAATVAAVVVFAAGTASAQDEKCRATIAKNVTKYQATLLKTVNGCNKSRSGGKVAIITDCTDLSPGANKADIKGKLPGARTKVTEGIAKSCNTTDNGAVLALYPRCPVPAKTIDDDPPTNGIDDFTELAECLVAISDNYVGQITRVAEGVPDAIVTDKDVAKCQGAVGKAVTKAISTIGKERSKCQSTAEKLAAGLVDYSTCNNTDPGGKIGPAITAVGTAITGSCGGLTTDQMGTLFACDDDAAGLTGCITSRIINTIGNGLVAAAHELPTICPTTANVLINAGIGAKSTRTRLDSGYTGLAHKVDVIDRYLGGVNLSGCDADCDSCDVTLDPTPITTGYTGTYSTCRCSNNPQTNCDAVNAADTECAGNICNCFFGPPLPLSSAGTPVCVSNVFQAEFDGETIGLGGYDVQTQTKARVFNGINVARPCPTCDGDAGFNDGVRGGSCNGGAQNGGTCDVNAVSVDFGSTSFDCQPELMKNISGTGLTLALNFNSGTQLLAAAIPQGGACTAGTCHCLQCTGDATVGCTNNADCAILGAGNCTGGTASRQNSCDSLDCAVDPADPTSGLCGPGTPTVSHCDGLVREDDREGVVGIITCTDDSDCEALDADCGGDCGACIPDQIQSCFLPTITATGEPGIINSIGVSTFCTAQTSNVGVNGAGGLPGPGRVNLDFSFQLYCGGVPYAAPGVATCP